MASGSTSTERRFITLLAADTDQLPYHLRQMLALLKEQSIDFGDLLNKLLFWNDEQKRTQNTWARDFYRNLNQETEIDQHTKKEISE
jgi:CRISPR system Cascade subunit CasB